MNGTLQNVRTAHDMQKQHCADRMSQMTFKKGSQVWNIQYTTQ
jgi:hypothetical protein